MSTRAFSTLIPIAIAAALTSSEARADATQAMKDEASQRFKSGVAFYNDRDFTAAMVEFKRAYDLVPNYAVLFNIGQTARELRDYAAALSAFERYLRDGGAKIDAKRKNTVQTSIDELKRKVGKLKITSNVDGAEVAIDDVRVGATPIADPVVVNAGQRKVTATLGGYAPLQKVVEIGGQADAAVALELVKIEIVKPPETPVEAPKSVLPLASWISLSATGATAILTGVMGGLAVSARGSLKDALATFPGDPVAIASAQSRTRTFATATDVFIGLTAAGAAATTVLFVLASRSGEKAKPGEPAKAPVTMGGAPPNPPARPAASLGVSPAGIVVRGAF